MEYKEEKSISECIIQIIVAILIIWSDVLWCTQSKVKENFKWKSIF